MSVLHDDKLQGCSYSIYAACQNVIYETTAQTVNTHPQSTTTRCCFTEINLSNYLLQFLCLAPTSSINKLQIVQNAAARVLTRSRKYDRTTPILQSMHWLPIKFCISYKILLHAYKALNGWAPAYLTNLLSRYNPTRSLRSQNSGLLVAPRTAKSTKGGRTFSYLAPKLWNSLPDNVRGLDTLSLFKSRLRTRLFSQAFI